MAGENERFKAIRDNRKINQLEFAEKLGKPQSYVSAMEHGRKALTYEMLERLLIVFDVNPAFIIIGEPYQMYMSEQRTTDRHPDMLQEEVERVEYGKEELIEKELKRAQNVERAAIEFRKALQAMSKKRL